MPYENKTTDKLNKVREDLGIEGVVMRDDDDNDARYFLFDSEGEELAELGNSSTEAKKLLNEMDVVDDELEPEEKPEPKKAAKPQEKNAETIAISFGKRASFQVLG